MEAYMATRHESEAENTAKNVRKRFLKGADGKSYEWLDADSVVAEGDDTTIRLKGFNAAETSKIIDRDGEIRFVQGQLGAKEQTEAIANIAEAGGFNIFQDTGEFDTYGRRLGTFVNEDGEDLTEAVYSSGLVDVNLFTDQKGIDAARRGRLQEQLRGTRGQYGDIVNEAMGDLKYAPVMFKETATNEREYLDSIIQVVAEQKGLNLYDEDEYRQAYNTAISGNYDTRSVPFAAIDFRYGDRTKEGVAYNQMTESWNTGWKGMSTALYGFAELIGVELGSDTIKNWGAENVEQAKDDLANSPILRNVDYRDVDGVWDAWEFFTNNMAMSAPYLVTLTAGHVLSPVTFGASVPLAYGSILGTHAGNVWNDIEGPKGRKEASGAIIAGTAMAVLDRIGMKGIMKPSTLLTKEGRLQVAAALKKQNPGMTSAQALALINKETKSVIKGAIEGMGNFSADHINNSAIIKEVLKGAGRSGVIEGVTEASQEGLGYLSSKAMSEGGLKENFNPNEFSNILASSAVAGGALGTGFGGAGQIVEAGDRYAMQKGLMLGRVDKLNPYDQLSQDLGKQGSVFNITEEARNATLNKSGGTKAAQRARQGEKARGSIWSKLKDPTKYVPELYRAAATTAFRPELLRRSAAARKLYALVGQPLGRLYSGRDVQAQEAKYRGDMLSTINPQRVFKRFGMADRVSNSNKISNMIRRFYIAGGDPVALANDKEVMENYEAIEATIKELKLFSAMSYALKNDNYKAQGNNRDNLTADPDAWVNDQSWDWQKVRDNREAWFDWMRKNALDKDGNQLYTENELLELYNKVSNNEDATDFSIVEGIEYIPGAGKGGTELLSSKPGFEQFANTDIIQNAISTANQTAKYAAYTEYFGAGGKYLDYLFDQMENEGLTREEIAEMAYHTKSIIDAGTGNFKSIKNRKLAAFMRSATFYTSIVGLPLAAFSSLPEFIMMIYQARGMNDINRAINIFTGELVGALKQVAKMKIHPSLANVPLGNIYRNSTNKLISSGLFPDDATVATRYGLGETDISKAWYQKAFFKWTGIAGITQLQRSMAAAAVSGFVSDRIKILMARKEGTPYNQDQLEIYRQLTNLGMDVDKYIQIQRKYNSNYKDSEGKTRFDRLMDEAENGGEITSDIDFVKDQLDTVTWYFTNDRIQNPQAYNRPLFFQDPHFQLFVQFNGFISTFTANVVPKLWNDYLKNGSPRMKYNTFALAVTMIAVGGASQWLKDYIKFGGSTPYLNDAQLVQRAIMSSGIMGSAERIVQGVAPMYSDRNENIVSRLFGETVGGAPTVRLADTARKALVEAAEGDYPGFLTQTGKLLPVGGAVTPVRNVFKDLMQGQAPSKWPFDQDTGE